jgi:hypothetical protein
VEQQLPIAAAVAPPMVVAAVLTGIARISALHKGPPLSKEAGFLLSRCSRPEPILDAVPQLSSRARVK